MQLFIYLLIRGFLLYIPEISNIVKKLYEHRTGKYLHSFTSKYALTKLVYCGVFQRVEDVIAREKQIKGCSRLKKENLIISMNPNWNDLSNEFGID